MLESLFIHSLDAFSDDYKALCKHHYPTIHNRGMSPEHLSSAFHRRLTALAFKEGKKVSCSLFSHDIDHHLYIYTLDIDSKKVWCIYPLFLNAKTEAKTQILTSIDKLFVTEELKKDDYVAVLCDHWFDRTRSSKTLYHWWNDCLPESNELYLKQGIQNLPSEEHFSAILEEKFQLACINHSIYHPLESNQQHALLKYSLCFALFQYPRHQNIIL